MGIMPTPDEEGKQGFVRAFVNSRELRAVNADIDQLFRIHADLTRIRTADIPRIKNDARRAWLNGRDLEAAVKQSIEEYQYDSFRQQ